MTPVLDYIVATTRARQTGPEKFFGHGVCHGSQRHPDLSIRISDNKILLHCFAGCRPEETVSALGLQMKDLFLDAPLPRGQRPALKAKHIDRFARAFEFELGAFDRRQRAEKILAAASGMDGGSLSDDQRDRLMQVVSDAYADLDRADVFKGVADTLRRKDFDERGRQ